MKLVEILARELGEWPEGATSITQDYDGDVGIYSIRNPELVHGDKHCHVWHQSGHVKNISNLSRVASDASTAIVTREMWQAERERIAKPGKKANADGWIRNRGRTEVSPYKPGELFDFVNRVGELHTANDVGDGCCWVWRHSGASFDIMRHRTHKPAEQRDETEYVGPFPTGSDDSGIKVDIDFPSGVIHIDGPLAWRDRIREIDRTVEALEEERVSLIQRLEGEGFKLIEQVNAKIAEAAQAHQDMSDPSSWKVGDCLRAIGGCGGFSFHGQIVKVLVVRDDGGFEVATKDEPDYGWYFTDRESATDLEFHSRPSA